MKEHTGSSGPDKSAAGRAPRVERRRLARVKLTKSVRICPIDANLSEEVQPTLNASPHGVYFATQTRHYFVGMSLLIAPVDQQGRICGSDYVSEVARIDRLPDGRLGIAIRFLGNDAGSPSSEPKIRRPPSKDV